MIELQRYNYIDAVNRPWVKFYGILREAAALIVQFTILLLIRLKPLVVDRVGEENICSVRNF